MKGRIRRRTLPVGLPENYFRKNGCHLQNELIDRKGGVWQGNLIEMVEAVLATLPLRLPRPIDAHRTYNLYMKSKMGLTRGWRLLVEIHVKPFRRWVRKNALRLMVPVGELEERATERETKYETEYYDGLEADERLIEEKFPEEGNEAVIPSCPREG